MRTVDSRPEELSLVGSRIGRYEITGQISCGGMGQVLRARDTRLDREVAIKVLPSELAADQRFRLRFEREAKAVSALRHPNICVLHDYGRDGERDYLVMELCDGQTLRSRLDRGALRPDRAVEIGIQIAEALSCAHRAGIVHRDLKPANVMLTRSGAKLLDFGLARQVGTSPSSSTRPTTSLTQEGKLLGTLQYMAPEVLNGAEATAGSDIFALGLVLYEMLTGMPAFAANSKASLIAAILEHEATPIRELKPDLPPALQHIIDKCLAKSPDERWESAHDVAEELRWVIEQKTAPRVAAQHRLAVAASAAVLIAIAAVLWITSRRPDSDRVVRFSTPLSSGGWYYDVPLAAFSPDGSRMAYALGSSVGPALYVRPIDAAEGTPISGTENAFGPFFSPDGQWIGYVAKGNLMKCSLSGGAPQTIAHGIVGTGRGATWGPDGNIYYTPGPDNGLWSVSADGGTPVQLTQPDSASGENSHRWPEMLPDGKHLLFTIRTDQISSFDSAKIAVLSLETRKWKVVLDGGSGPRYLAPGHLLFGRGGDLYVVPFDEKSVTVTGKARKVVSRVVSIQGSGTIQYAVSSRGDLAYVLGEWLPRTSIVSVDRAGAETTRGTLEFAVDRSTVSPDGGRVAISAFTANSDIWIYDLRSGSGTRFSFERGDESSPVWSADGSSVIYGATHPVRLLLKNIHDAEPVELLRAPVHPTSCSPDGKFLAFTYASPAAGTGYDLWLLSLNGVHTLQPLLQTPFNEFDGQFSPDGKWLAYVSDQTGAREVYVRAAASPGASRQVSVGGGVTPRWSRDAQKLYYVSPSATISAVAISGSASDPQSGTPQLVVSTKFARYDTTVDGLLLLKAREVPHEMIVVVNWAREIRQDATAPAERR